MGRHAAQLSSALSTTVSAYRIRNVKTALGEKVDVEEYMSLSEDSQNVLVSWRSSACLTSVVKNHTHIHVTVPTCNFSALL
jgi:hypothetical protein